MDLSKIRMLILDVDGVLTDGTILLHEDGSESKRFNIQDGHGMKLWMRTGLKLALISGRHSGATTQRAAQLGIDLVYQGQTRKLPAFERLLREQGLTAEEVAYVGDDLLDLPLVKRAGCGVAVANAVQELRDAADRVTKAAGGGGAVREVIEWILKSTGRWDPLMERYLI